MKNIYFFSMILTMSFLVCVTSCSSHDADVDTPEIPAMIKNSFDATFPEAKMIDWENIAPWYKIDFKEDSFEKNAWFGASGEWLMTQTSFGPYTTFLPFPIQEFFQQSIYSDWQVEAVDGFERRTDSFYMIEADMPGLDEIKLIFAEDGTLLHIADAESYQIFPNIIFHTK